MKATTTFVMSVGIVVLAVAETYGNDRDKPSPAKRPLGVTGPVGCLKNPRKVARLRITRPGVYENYLVDSRWAGGNRVKITADNVTLRNCEIRNATGNGVGVFGKNVVIENCRIHHLLAGSFSRQKDAHGITGGWNNVTIRNCEIYYVSGDCIQFDPDRRSRGKVLIENCNLWTGPLPRDAAGFKRGERPGENAFDSKTPPGGPRCRVTIRNCLIHGWRQPGQISLLAALNLKENVDARVERCLFKDNQVCFRLRGPTRRGGARVCIVDCAVFDSDVGVRMEDNLRNLRIDRMGIGRGIKRAYHRVGRGKFPGYKNTGEHKAPPYDRLRLRGFGSTSRR
ncbi:MAG: right-handed parallel beta-helix repeat-containing protein [Planctomycetaceae bacterium]